MKTLLLSSILLSSFVVTAAPQGALAEDVACIAIYPCDESGNLRAEFLDPANPCFSYFEKQCKRTQEGNDPRCEEAEDQVSKLQKQVRTLKFKLKFQKLTRKN